jgi:amidase
MAAYGERPGKFGLTAALVAFSAVAAQAQSNAPNSPSGAPPCAVLIGAVLADVSARDLDTERGPPLNAFPTLNPNAVAQAQALDRRAASGEPRGPLFCMPVAVKDNFDTYDMPATAGSLALMGNQAPRDAPFVARLRDAGAIVIGKTNMDEFAMGIRGLSGAGGRVGNAYDTAQSAGGSSSGSAVAVGAGFVPFALGSDNCGSLRIPAAYNGAVALRATYGRFDTHGIFPIGFVNGVPGVIARDGAMLNAALAVAADGWRAEAAAKDAGLLGKRIGVLRRFDGPDPWALSDAGPQKVFAGAMTILRKAGAEIVEDVAARPIRRAARGGVSQGLRAQGLRAQGRRCLRGLPGGAAELAGRMHVRAHPAGMVGAGMHRGRRILTAGGAQSRRPDRKQPARHRGRPRPAAA